MSIVSNIVSTYLPAKKKTTPSGWISFNAPCCHYNGHAQDTRGRGGLIINGDEGVSYHCFNCGFKCSWQVGRTLSIKFKKFLSWIGTPDNIISQLSLDLLKQLNNSYSHTQKIELPKFENIELPKNSICLNKCAKIDSHRMLFLEYMVKRNLNFTDTEFYYTDQLGYKDRLIIPFYFNKNIVGFTARHIKNKNPKYLTNSQPGYIYNLNNQNLDWKYLIVTEGPIDALHINGVSILGSEISQSQILLLESYKKEIIVIPDRDASGKKLFQQTLDLGWSVSFPSWDKNINDVSDAVTKYGKLLTLYSIIKYKETNKLKQQLGAKKWFG